MVESVGKKLNQARLKRGLTVDEAAHATKLRPDKIAALEADDYSRFANNIYAKGFLQIYARFLNVDVSDFARTLDNANPISVSDYQYLSNAPAPRRETTTVQREERKPPSLAPLLFFVIIVAGGLFFSWVIAKSHQFERSTTQSTPSVEESPSPAPATPDLVTSAPAVASPAPQVRQIAPALTTPQPAPALATPAFARTAPTPPPVASSAPGRTTPAPLQFTSTATPTPVPNGLRPPEPPKPSDQDFVRPTPVDQNAQAAPPNGVNEVQVAAVKKTWVTVRKDDPKAAPIFEDYIYPSANPLKLKGARFFIDARDPNSVQITKNGLPYAYQAPNVPVQ